MSKRFTTDEEYEREMQTLKTHLERLDKAFEKQGTEIGRLQKTIDEVLILLSGSVIGKTKGLVEIVSSLSDGMEDFSQKFIHAEKWRIRFMEGEKERREMQLKKTQIQEDRKHEEEMLETSRKHQEELKTKEITALKKSNVIKNWLTAASVLGVIVKIIWDHYNK